MVLAGFVAFMLIGGVVCRKRCYEKKEGKAAAAPGSNMDPLGRVTIHDRFFPANLH